MVQISSENSKPFRSEKKKKRRLLSCSYNSHKNNTVTQLQIIGKTLDKLSTSCDNIIFLGEFNVEPVEAKMSEFLNIQSKKSCLSKNLFQEPRKSFVY